MKLVNIGIVLLSYIAGNKAYSVDNIIIINLSREKNISNGEIVKL